MKPRSVPEHPVILGRRICLRCRRWRPVSDYMTRREPSGAMTLYSRCNLCKKRTYREWKGQLGFIDAGPIRELVRRQGGLQTDLARRTGVSERTLARLVNTDQLRVRWETADKIATACGHSIWALYPEDGS